MNACKDCGHIFVKPDYEDGIPICPDCASEHIYTAPEEPRWVSVSNYNGREEE